MYVKIIQSGEFIERFQYEKSPAPQVRTNGAKSRYGSHSGNDDRARFGRRSSSVVRAQRSFFRLVRANTGRGEAPALLTLTMLDIVSLREAWCDFTAFIVRLNKEKYPRVRYIAVPEFQKRGAVHFHVLIWGLTYDEISTERKTRYIQGLWGKGFLDVVFTDGSPKLSGYLAKYMSKAMQDRRNFGRKAYSVSRGLVHPVSVSAPSAVDLIDSQIAGKIEITEDGFKDVDNPPLHPLRHRVYDTPWLGRAEFTSYNLSGTNEE